MEDETKDKDIFVENITVDLKQFPKILKKWKQNDNINRSITIY